MYPKSQKINIVKFHPTHVLVEFSTTGKQVKLKKQFFQKRVKAGLLEVVNKENIPFVI